jgi:16S rRNA (guanine1207-N2)-methyltransferase
MAPDDAVEAPDHYFTERPRSPSQRRELRFLFRGSVLVFEVDRGVFGSSGLDPGTALLIESLGVRPTDRVLDLGCGWGPVGVAAAKAAPDGRVLMTDVNRRAIALARRNVRRNKLANAEVRAGSLFATVGPDRFDVIATNPPYHAGRDLIVELLTSAPDHLADDGRLLVVGKGSQGILYYQRWLAEHWARPVSVLARGGGYRVVEARRREVSDHA